MKQDYVFDNINKDSLEVFSRDVWKDYFYLHELTEIVRQQSDPTFAEIMSRVRVGTHTLADVKILDAMSCHCCKLKCRSQCQCECTCTSNWPVEPITLYFTNNLAKVHNERRIESLGTEIFEIKARDSARDEATQTCDLVKVDMSLNISDTGNLPGLLKLCIGARVLLTVNLNVSDGLSNGALGVVVGIRGKEDKLLKGDIYVKFDISDVGSSNKIQRGQFEGAVPIKSRAETFSLRRTKSTILVTRRQFPLILAHAITIHKSQSATYKYMVADFDRATRNEKVKLVVQPGHAYTALSRGEDRDRIVLKNFAPSNIKVNKNALKEMERLRNGKLLKNIWCHPLEKKTGCILSLLNIRSWNLHIEHFISDSIHHKASDMFCFTETHIKDKPTITINTLNDNWSNVFKGTEHGLAFCYKNETVAFIEEFETLGNIEMMAILIESKGCKVIVIIVYRPGNKSASDFMNSLVDEIEALPSEYRKVIVGDFNLDLRLQDNNDLIEYYCNQLDMVQKVDYTTHIHGGILDLVFDINGSTGSTDWMPTPYSDHFVIYYDV